MNKPYKLPKLKRLDSTAGESAGWWAVQDLPGCIVYRRPEGMWSFYFYPPGLQQDWMDWEKMPAVQKLLENSKLAKQAFQTRREALQALQTAWEFAL